MRARHVVFFLLSLLALSATAWAAFGTHSYRNAAYRIAQLDMPRGWETIVPSQIGFPRIIIMATNGPSRLTLAVQKILPGTSALDLAAGARALLERQGWREQKIAPDGELVLLEAQLPSQFRQLYQYYVADGDMAYIFSSSSPTNRAERVLRDLSDMVHSLVIAPLGATAAPTIPDAGRGDAR